MNVAVIGCGRMGRLHVAAYQRCGATVVAVADADISNAEAVAAERGTAAYASYQQLLAEHELSAVSVCTPPAMHQGPVVAAARQGAGVLCEKPLAESSATARAMVEALSTTEVPVMVGFFHRFHEPLTKLKGLLADDTFGRPVTVRSRFSLDEAEDTRPWISDRAVAGGGAMMNTAVHSLDIVRFLTGAEIATVQSVTAHARPAAVLEDTVLMLVTGDHGDLGIVEAYSSAPFRTYELWVQGPAGEAVVGWEPPSLHTRTTDSPRWREVPVDATSALDRVYRGVQRFVACVRESRQPEDGTVADGLRALELAEAGYRSAQAGVRITGCSEGAAGVAHG